MKIPSGWIFRPTVDYKGINITLEQSELVLCGDCRHFKYGTTNFPNQCTWHSGFCPDDDWFCADAEKE